MYEHGASVGMYCLGGRVLLKRYRTFQPQTMLCINKGDTTIFFIFHNKLVTNIKSFLKTSSYSHGLVKK